MIVAAGRHLIESTIFACLVMLVAWLLRRRGAASVHALYLTAAIKFALPAAIFLTLGIRAASLLPNRYSPPLASSNLPGRVYAALWAPPLVASQAPRSWRATVLAALWSSGAMVMLLLWIRRARASAGRTTPCSGPEIHILDRMRHRLAIRRTVDLRESARGSAVGVWGIWHPAIHIPQGLSSQLTPQEFETVLLHELAHVRRWDNLASSFVEVLARLFWFHPLLWWIERRMVFERERACDEMAIHHGAAPEIYVSGILKVCRFQLAEAMAGAVGIKGPDFKRRMELIMSCPIPKSLPRAPRALLGALAAVITVAPFLGGFLQQPALRAQTGVSVQQAPLGAKPAQPAAVTTEQLVQAQRPSEAQAAVKTAAPLPGGAPQQPALTGKTGADDQQSPPALRPIICFFAGVAYPEGTVLRDASETNKICANDRWEHTDKPAAFVLLADNTVAPSDTPVPPPLVCKHHDGEWTCHQ